MTDSADAKRTHEEASIPTASAQDGVRDGETHALVDALLARCAAALKTSLLVDASWQNELLGRLAPRGETEEGGLKLEVVGTATSEDFAALVDAFGLLESRVSRLEGRLETLAAATATVAAALDSKGHSGSSDGPESDGADSQSN